MTTIHKNSYKTNKKPLPTPPNTLKVFHIYIGRPQKKKNRKILTQGKSCFFIVNATKCIMYCNGYLYVQIQIKKKINNKLNKMFIFI